MRKIRIVAQLPLSQQEVQLGQNYMDFIIDYDILKSRRENLEYQENGKRKIMYLCDNLPVLVTDMLTGGILEIQELKNLQGATKQQTFSCPNFPSFKCEVNTKCEQGSFQSIIEPDCYTTIQIDPVNDNLEYFRSYQSTITQRIASNCKIQNLQNWKNEFTGQKSSTVQEISLFLQYGEAQQILENELIESLRKFYLYYYKCMLITMNKWIILSPTQIEKKQQNLIQRKNKKVTNPKHIYNQMVNNYQDLTNKTNFLEVRNRFSKLLNQSISDISVIQGRPQNHQNNSYVHFNQPGRVSLHQPNTNNNNEFQFQKNGFQNSGSNNYNNNQWQNDDLSNCSQIVIKKNIIRKKAGTILKRGDGPIDFGWNERYLVLDCETLMYFKTFEDKTPRGFLKLKSCKVSEVQSFDERQFTFYIESFTPERKLYFSADTKEETQEWRDEFFKAINDDNLQDEEERKKQKLIKKRKQSHNDTMLVHKKLQTSVFPQTFQPFRPLINDLEHQLEDNEQWYINKYRNGVRIYNKSQNSSLSNLDNTNTPNKNNNQKKPKHLQKFMYIVPIIYALIAFQTSFLSQLPIFLNISIGMLLYVGIFIFQKHQNKGSSSQNNSNSLVNYEVASKVILDEQASHIFTHLKKNSFKQKIDFNLTKTSKSSTNPEQPLIKKSTFTYQFTQSKKNSKISKNQSDSSNNNSNGLQNINTENQKTRFIHNSGKFYIIFESTLKQDNDQQFQDPNQKKKNTSNQIFKLTEIFVISKYDMLNNNASTNCKEESNKQSQQQNKKCQIYFYSHIQTNIMNKHMVEKNLNKRAQQLAVLREIIKEEAVKQFNNNSNINGEQQENYTQNGKNESSNNNNNILNQLDTQRLKMYSKLPNEMKKNFDEQIKLVDQMKQDKNLLNVKRKSLEDRKNGYKRMKEGGIGCFNKEEIQNQEGLVMDLVKKAGRQLVEGKNIVSISLPVRIFEPRSTLERICDSWSFIPIYLKKASKIKDNPLERFKLTITCVMAGLYMSCKQQKPFNPILGETFQGFFADGTKIDIEHTSHHPPVSHFMIEDEQKKFKFFGHYEYKAKLKGTSVLGKQEGPQTVVYSDGQTISWEYPDQKVNGLLYGTRTMEWLGSIKFVDKTYNYECVLTFYESGFFSSAKHPTDYFEGVIIKKDKPEEVYSKVNGSWVDFIEFDGVRYWDLSVIDPAKLIHTLGPMDSDCRYREDLVWLAKKDMDQSQEWKVKLEVLQRRDRANRKNHTEGKPIIHSS